MSRIQGSSSHGAVEEGSLAITPTSAWRNQAMVSSDPISARPRGSQIDPNSVVSGSERTVSRGRAALISVERAWPWGAGANADAPQTRDEARRAEVFMVVVKVSACFSTTKTGVRSTSNRADMRGEITRYLAFLGYEEGVLPGLPRSTRARRQTAIKTGGEAQQMHSRRAHRNLFASRSCSK